MKVRWTSESVRFRITPTELERLHRSEPVSETLALPGGGRWAVTIMSNPTEPTRLESENGDLILHLAPEEKNRLAVPDAEGIYFTAGGLRLIIEKDFPCVHPRALEAAEPPTETFAPPPDFAARKEVAA